MRTVDEMRALSEMIPLKLNHYIWVNFVDIELTALVKSANRPLFLLYFYLGNRSTLESFNEDYWNLHHKKGGVRGACKNTAQ